MVRNFICLAIFVVVVGICHFCEDDEFKRQILWIGRECIVDYRQWGMALLNKMGNMVRHAMKNCALKNATIMSYGHDQSTHTIPFCNLLSYNMCYSTTGGGAVVEGPKVEVRRIDYHQKMTPVRMRIIERMMRVQRTAAMLTTFNEVNMSNLYELLGKYSGVFSEKNGIPLTYMGFFVRAAAISLGENPSVNASMDVDSIIQHKYIDVAVSMATRTSIVSPVLRDVANCDVSDIEKQLNILNCKTQNDELSIEDLTGATFSIANDGAIGALLGTQILNPPQSAILGMNMIHQRPTIIKDGTIKICPMMYISLTYDHRIIDGKDAVTMLKRIKGLIEDPDLLFLDL